MMKARGCNKEKGVVSECKEYSQDRIVEGEVVRCQKREREREREEEDNMGQAEHSNDQRISVSVRDWLITTAEGEKRK